MTRRPICFALVSALLCATAPSYGQSDAVLLERTAPVPSGFYRANIYGSGIPAFLYPQFHLASVVAFSHPVIAPSIPAFARIEETAASAFLVVRDSRSGDSLAQYSVPRGSSNVHWNQAGSIVLETPPVNGVGALISKDPMTGRTMDSTTVARQYMIPSAPTQGACVVAPTSNRFAFVRVSSAEDGAANIPIPAYQDVGSPIARYPIPPYTTARVNGKEEKRVLVACGPAAPRIMRHLSWSASATMIAFYGVVTFDRPFPTDTTRTYRMGSEGIFVLDIFSREVREIRTTKNVAAEHPDQFFFAPTGWNLAYTVRPDGAQPRVFVASAERGGQGVDLGEGTFITGQTSDLSWHCSPWSRTGGRLIVRRNDGSISTRPLCGSDLVIMDGASQQLTLLSAQSADVDARPFTPSTMVLDPWPDLINNTGGIRNDAWMMLPRTHQVRGCAADGASRLVLRITVPEWMTDEVSVSLRPENCAEGVHGDMDTDGSLSPVGSTLRTYQTSVKPRIENGVGVCGVVYNAPEDFVAEAGDTARTVRTIRIAVTARDVQSFVDIEIVRPPLILVHGIWSSAALFNVFYPITTSTTSDGRFRITRLDYSDLSTKRVDQIIGPLGSGIPLRLEQATTTAYRDHVAVRSDVVGHSLGPVLMRYMAASRFRTVFTRRNGGMGHVHKLISLDSPHQGSEYCNLLSDAALNNPNRVADLDEVLSRFVLDGVGWDPVTGGIVDDLRLTSAVITVSKFPDFLTYHPRLHTIYSEVTDAQESANSELIWLIDAIAGLDLSQNTFSAVFKGAKNDLVVSSVSQRADGIYDHDPERTTRIDGVAHSDGFDEVGGVVNGVSGAAQRVIDLLHAPSNGPLFSSRSTPFPLSFERDRPTEDRDAHGLVVPASLTPLITIVSPDEGAIIAPGELITIRVDPVGTAAVYAVAMVTRGTIVTDSVAPFAFEWTVPTASDLGPLDITMVGILSNNTSFDITEHRVIHVRSAHLCTALTITGDSVVTLDGTHQRQRLCVKATFSDGVERAVERDSSTVLTSRDTTVCTVTDGWVQYKGAGSTVVVANRGGLLDSITVVCMPANHPPVADAGSDTTLPSPGTIAIDAMRSFDIDGDSLSVRWWTHRSPPGVSVIIGNQTSATTTATISGDGLVVVGLDVSDAAGDRDTAWKFIRVGATTTVSEEGGRDRVDAWPTPCSSTVFFTAPLHPHADVLCAYSTAGVCFDVSVRHINTLTSAADVRQLPPGSYMLDLGDGASSLIHVMR
jgi:hypothetical protein